MINLIISLLTAAGIVLTGFSARALFTKVAVKKEMRYKEKTIILIMVLTLLAVAIFNGIFAVWSFYNEDMKKFYDFFNSTLVTGLCCLSIILIWIIVKWIYSYWTNKRNDNEIGEDYKLPYLYYSKAITLALEEGEVKKHHGYIVKSAATYSKTLKTLATIVIWFNGIYSGVQAYFSLTDKSILFNYMPITAFYLITFIAELAVYMDGAMEEKKADIRVAEKKEKEDKLWVDLSDEYEAIWKNKLLATYKISDKGSKVYIKGDKENKTITTEDIAENIASNDRRGSKFSNGRVVSQILSGKNLIIESEIIVNYTEVMFPVINILFAANKKLLFLCDSEYTVNMSIEWLNTLQLKKEHGSIVVEALTYQEVEKEAKLDSNIDIYVSTVELALKGKLNYKDIDVVISINTDRILSTEALDLSILCSIFTNNSREDIQYILFSKRVNGLEQAISNVFMHLDFSYIVENSMKDREVVIDFWSGEKGWLQSNIISGYGASFMGQLIPLAMPALKRDIYGVGIITSEEPYVDEFNSVYKSQPMMKKYMHNKEIINIDESINFYENGNFVSIKENDILILEDHNKNVSSCTYNWSRQGKKNLFIHIVASQYLLRDYFIDNIDFFLGNSEAAAAIMPVQQNNIKLAVFRIISELCQGMEEEKLLINLNRLGVDTDDTNSDIQKIIIKALNKLTLEAFSVNIFFDIYLKAYNVSEEWKKEIFERKRYYKLLSSVINELPQRLFKNLKFIDSEKKNKIINTIPAYELYQNYLEGQYTTISGRNYLIDRIDYDKAVVELLYAPMLNNVIYRQNRIVSVNINNQEPQELPSYSVGNSKLSQRIYRGDVVVDTKGYYQFADKITFVKGEYIYREINSSKTGLKRNYHNGNVLVWNITSEKTRENSNRDNFYLSFTLSLLLNEIFETLFPEVNQYIITRCAIKDSGLIDNSSEIIHMFEPILYPDSNDHSITLFILEDTELEKGITKTIVNSIDSIIRLLFDYLLWLTNKDDRSSVHDRWLLTGNDDSLKICSVDKYSFLRYGLDKLPEYIIPEKLLECLNDVVTKDVNTFSNHRLDFINKRHPSLTNKDKDSSSQGESIEENGKEDASGAEEKSTDSIDIKKKNDNKGDKTSSYNTEDNVDKSGTKDEDKPEDKTNTLEKVVSKRKKK